MVYMVVEITEDNSGGSDARVVYGRLTRAEPVAQPAGGDSAPVFRCVVLPLFNAREGETSAWRSKTRALFNF
jgi:hypothetical protein